MKKNVLFIIFIFCLIENVFAFSFFTPLIDKDRRINKQESQIIQSLIDDYFDYSQKIDYENLEKNFYKQNVQMSIEYNNLLQNDNEDNSFIGKINNKQDYEKCFSGLINYAGNLIQITPIKSLFSKQPYDYPVGNVYYIVQDCEYQNIKVRNCFYIINENNNFVFYEIRISIL